MSKNNNTFKSNTTALAPEVLAWVKEYKKKIEDSCIEDIPVKDTLFYKYAGILTKEYKIYTDKYNVDPLFVCDLPSEVVAILNKLVDDVKKQALTEYVSLFNPLEAFGLFGGWVSEWDEEEESYYTSGDGMGTWYEYSYLPKSLVRFAKETDAPYELIVHIVALAYSPNIAKITLFDEHLQFPFDHPFTSNFLIMTSDYDKAKNYIDDMKFVYEDCWDHYLDSLGRCLPEVIKWHQLGLTIVTNDLGHEFFTRFIREDEE